MTASSGHSPGVVLPTRRDTSLLRNFCCGGDGKDGKIGGKVDAFPHGLRGGFQLLLCAQPILLG